MLSAFKEFVKSHQSDIILLIGVFLASLLSFAAGYIAGSEAQKQPLEFEQTEQF
jgi:hypothetical protein